MAEAKTKATAEETKATAEERVELYIPKGQVNDDPNFFISVNGVNYVLPRGKKSMVPPHIKAEYERSVRAQERLDENIDKMLEASK